MSPETFVQVWEIYEHAFPKEEKRALEQQQALLTNELYKILPYFDDSHTEVLGFITLWDLPAFAFWEHLAVKETCRGQGIGSQIIENTKRISSKDIIFEVELPDTEMAQRRIRLYERLGFHLNAYPYLQPPYQANTSGIEMQIMSYPHPLSPEEFQHVKKTLYREIYHYSG